MPAWLTVPLTTATILVSMAGETNAQHKEPSKPATHSLVLDKGDRIIARHGGEGASCVDFSPDGKWLASAGGDNVILVTDVATGKEIRRLAGYKGFIRSIAFSSDGKLLASAGDDQGVVLWDVASGKEIRRIGGHTNGLRIAVFSPDGKTIASSGFDEHIGLWDVASGKKLLFFRAHSRVPYSVAFSPDGTRLASGGDNSGEIRLWDGATGKPLRSWEAHKQCIYTVAFAPDGRFLASGGGDTTVRLWEAATGKEVCRFEGHKQSVPILDFSRDGRMLVTASNDETVHIWETLTGTEIRRCGKHGHWVWGVSFSPTGRCVASASKDGTAVLWELGKAPEPNRPQKELAVADLDTIWRELAGTDASKAYQAGNRLAAAPPTQVIAFLKQHLRVSAPVPLDEARVERLIRDLNDRAFKVREQAFSELELLGKPAGPALRRGLAVAPSLDARRRIESLLAGLESREISPETLRFLRAMRVLEELNLPESRRILKDLAGGLPDDLVTQEAARVMGRLTRIAEK